GPRVGVAIGQHELGERIDAADAPTQLGGDRVDLFDEADVARMVAALRLEPATSLGPFVAREGESIHQPSSCVQQRAGHRGSTSPRIRSPRSYPGLASANAACA